MAKSAPLSAAGRRVSEYRLMADKLDIGPHSRRLLVELEQAARAGLPLCQIIVAATLVDSLANETSDDFNDDLYLEDDASVASSQGLSWLTAQERRALDWLRHRRNGLVHYEGVVSGMTGTKQDEADLKADAELALSALIPLLDSLERVI